MNSHENLCDYGREIVSTRFNAACVVSNLFLIKFLCFKMFILDLKLLQYKQRFTLKENFTKCFITFGKNFYTFFMVHVRKFFSFFSLFAGDLCFRYLLSLVTRSSFFLPHFCLRENMIS